MIKKKTQNNPGETVQNSEDEPQTLVLSTAETDFLPAHLGSQKFLIWDSFPSPLIRLVGFAVKNNRSLQMYSYDPSVKKIVKFSKRLDGLKTCFVGRQLQAFDCR